MNTTDKLEQRIVETARNLFVERGFEKTSMSEIAAASGINRTTLHYYFHTKERMFQAVFSDIIRSFLPRIQVIFDTDMPFDEKLSQVLDVYIRIFTENPSLPRFILGEIDRDIDHLLETGRIIQLDRYLCSIEQVILREMERGTIRRLPVELILCTFMSQVTFPFLAKNLITVLFRKDEAGFTAFMQQWKTNTLHQMICLLS